MNSLEETEKIVLTFAGMYIVCTYIVYLIEIRCLDGKVYIKGEWDNKISRWKGVY